MLTVRIPGTYVEALVAGQALHFFVHNPADVIQRHHLAGEFYEAEELALIARHVTPATRFLDIGANVGNHVLYLCRVLGLQQLAVIEPNGLAIAILKLNLRLNGLEQVVDTSLLGYGLSDEAGRGDMVCHPDNLGGARFAEGRDGPFEIRTGDALLAGREFDFVKIDTEGMEMKCLRGIEELVRRCRPTMFIEVDNENTAAFLDWCAAHSYVVREKFRRYTVNENYLVMPE